MVVKPANRITSQQTKTWTWIWLDPFDPTPKRTNRTGIPWAHLTTINWIPNPADNLPRYPTLYIYLWSRLPNSPLNDLDYLLGSHITSRIENFNNSWTSFKRETKEWKWPKVLRAHEQKRVKRNKKNLPLFHCGYSGRLSGHSMGMKCPEKPG